jgi:Zn-dependent peptidase ImmA (M78 family)
MELSWTSTDWKKARAVADDLTERYSSPPIPVLEIAERSGVDVVFADMGPHADVVAGFCDFAAAKLYVNRADIPNRQSFTIAHELGHWLLHRDLFKAHPEKYPVLPRFQSTDKNNPVEQEANFFAANLLVPARLLKPVSNAPVAALAGAFKVSRTMMEYRVKNVR